VQNCTSNEKVGRGGGGGEAREKRDDTTKTICLQGKQRAELWETRQPKEDQWRPQTGKTYNRWGKKNLDRRGEKGWREREGYPNGDSCGWNKSGVTKMGVKNPGMFERKQEALGNEGGGGLDFGRTGKRQYVVRG